MVMDAARRHLFMVLALNLLFLLSHWRVDSMPTKCMPYTGAVCQFNEQRRYDSIRAGATQANLEQEIVDALEKYEYRYSKCKKYLRYLLCITKFPLCGKPLCKVRCNAAKNSTCFSDMSKDSHFYKWYTEEFICSSETSDGIAKSCYEVEDQSDTNIREQSCQASQRLTAEGRVSLINPNKPPKIDGKYLTERLPMHLISKDLKCCHKRQTLKSIIKGRIRKIKDLVGDNIEDLFVNGYCYSAATNTKVVQLHTLQEYRPNLKTVLRNVQVVVIQKQSKTAYLAIIGTNTICIDVFPFNFVISPLPSGGLLSYGKSDEPLQWKWVGYSENNPQLSDGDDFVRVFRKYLNTPSLVLSKPTQVIQWNNDSYYRLFKDDNAELIKYRTIDNKFKNIKSEILLGGAENEEKSVVLHLTSSEIDALHIAKIIMVGLDQFDSQFEAIFWNPWKECVKFKTAELFIQSKSKSTELNVPATEYFQSMRRLVSLYKDDSIVVTYSAEIVDHESKPKWLDSVPFKLRYRKSTINSAEFVQVDMTDGNVNIKDDLCKQKKKKDWVGFEKFLQNIDHNRQEDSKKEKIKITRKTVECTVCCEYDVFTLKSVELFDFSSRAANFRFVVTNQNTEITLSFDKTNFYDIIGDKSEFDRTYLLQNLALN